MKIWKISDIFDIFENITIFSNPADVSATIAAAAETTITTTTTKTTRIMMTVIELKFTDAANELVCVSALDRNVFSLFLNVSSEMSVDCKPYGRLVHAAGRRTKNVTSNIQEIIIG